MAPKNPKKWAVKTLHKFTMKIFHLALQFYAN